MWYTLIVNTGLIQIWDSLKYLVVFLDIMGWVHLLSCGCLWDCLTDTHWHSAVSILLLTNYVRCRNNNKISHPPVIFIVVVSQSLCPTLCNPVDYSMPGSPVLHSLPVCSDSHPLNQWFYLTISSSAALFSFCLQSFPASGSFPMSWLFASGSQNIRASASILSMNIQG